MAATAGPPARRRAAAPPFAPAARRGLLLVPLLGLYVAVCALSQPGPSPVNDEAQLLAAAERLLDGGYAQRGTLNDVRWLWHGPGVPLALAPLLVLGLPIEAIRMVLGPLVLFGTVVVAYRVLLRHAPPRLALLGALALGLYAPAMQPLRTVHKEPLAMLLVALALLFASRALAPAEGRTRWLDVSAAGVALGALVMVRLEYGWVLLGLLGACAAAVVVALARGHPPRSMRTTRMCAAILAVGLAFCGPWLAYTHDVSGRFPYWGNSGGESLFWMSPTGMAGQTGEFHGQRTVFKQAALAPARPLFRRLERLAPLQRDLALQRIARANIRARPAAWVRNVAANTARLWFLVPTRPAPPAGAGAVYVLFNTTLLMALAWAAAVLVRRRDGDLPALTAPVVAFAAAGLGIHLIPSADPRMALPLVPLLVWLVALAAAQRSTTRRGAPVVADHARLDDGSR